MKWMKMDESGKVPKLPKVGAKDEVKWLASKADQVQGRL